MSERSAEYHPASYETKWQDFWEQEQVFRACEPEACAGADKFYVLDMFPYPSGAGLHIGHPEGYTATDALKRFEKARGKNVLHPMGWDAFGLPTEQFAIKTGEHPRVVTARNVANFKRQLKLIGLAYDWSREVNTTDPAYVRWTQWIFLQLFRRGLAYVDEKPVWFCPELGTVLANEEVLPTPEGPRSERGNFPVEKRPLRQWVLRITAFAERLLEGLEGLDWPESTKALQRNWIGRSTGAEVVFDIPKADSSEAALPLKVFTTRPDTLYGATYMVIAPEHPYVSVITTPEQRDAVTAYVNAAKRKSDLERAELAKEKTGVATGAYAINPVNGEQIPVWVADYVLMTYGTGAIMAVPAHDQRDFEFAKTFGLPIRQVIADPEGSDDPLTEAYTGDGPLINSGELEGLQVAEAKASIIARLEREGRGQATVNYRLRDWLFSRQRYWGEPFPIVWVRQDEFKALPAYQREFLLSAEAPPQGGVTEVGQPVTCNMDGHTWVAIPLREDSLPLTLPEVDDYKPSPDGQSPLAKAEDWLRVFLNPETGEVRQHGERLEEPTELIEDQMARPADAPPAWIEARRETNTMPQWAGSCWYYLRYMAPSCTTAPVAPTAERYWQCPDLYVGGAEHAVLHLLYARFWHHVLYECGAVTTREPFPKLFHQGLILGEDGEKMSKSRGNVINPDDVIEEHGADALRVYLMFLGPLEQMKPWSTENIKGVTRFLRDVWRLVVGDDGLPSKKLREGTESPETLKLLHQTIKKVTEDYETLSFNTAIAQLMILKNHLAKAPGYSRDTLLQYLQLLAPLAPHLAEELWQRLGETPSIASASWPQHDEALLVESSVTLPVQIMGKVKGEVTVPKDAAKDAVLAAAKAVNKVAAALEGKTIVKEVYVPGRIVNFVVR